MEESDIPSARREGFYMPCKHEDGIEDVQRKQNQDENFDPHMISSETGQRMQVRVNESTNFG